MALGNFINSWGRRFWKGNFLREGKKFRDLGGRGVIPPLRPLNKGRVILIIFADWPEGFNTKGTIIYYLFGVSRRTKRGALEEGIFLNFKKLGGKGSNYQIPNWGTRRREGKA